MSHCVQINHKGGKKIPQESELEKTGLGSFASGALLKSGLLFGALNICWYLLVLEIGTHWPFALLDVLLISIHLFLLKLCLGDHLPSSPNSKKFPRRNSHCFLLKSLQDRREGRQIVRLLTGQWRESCHLHFHTYPPGPARRLGGIKRILLGLWKLPGRDPIQLSSPPQLLWKWMVSFHGSIIPN